MPGSVKSARVGLAPALEQDEGGQDHRHAEDGREGEVEKGELQQPAGRAGDGLPDATFLSWYDERTGDLPDDGRSTFPQTWILPQIGPWSCAAASSARRSVLGLSWHS